MTSTIKVNKIEKVDGSTIELGGPGTSVNLASGATQSGFGRTGTVNWCTTAKTSPLTVESGKGYFINTTSGVITVTLPSSPSAGDIVAFKDYANTWDTNKVTVGRGGSKINGVCEDATLKTESQSVTLIYVDGTKGWQDIHDSTSNVTGSSFICASGGNAIVTCGNFKTHIFTGSGTFTVNSTAAAAPDNAVQYLVVAGGAGGGGSTPPAGGMGGGGAGGFRVFSSAPGCNSPLVAPAGLTVTATSFPISVGAAGTAGPGTYTPPHGDQQGGSGGNSIFSSIASAGGGGGGSSGTRIPNSDPCAAEGNGVAGGSGGGGSYRNPGKDSIGGAGNTPPVSPPQGNPGGQAGGAYGPNFPASGGGGAAAAGGPGQPGNAGDGGIGSFIADPFIGPTAPSYGAPGPVSNVRYFAGGGGGGGTGGGAGTGGGGAGGPPGGTAGAGTANTGGGGGGGDFTAGATGGSGIVMIRYRFQ